MSEKLIDHYINDVNGLFHFAEDFLGEFLTQTTPEFHKEIYDLIRNKSRLALAAPRSFAKSTLVSVIFPLYCLTFKLKQDIVIISASETLAVEWLRKIKHQLMFNEDLRGLYLGIYGKEPQSDKWAENHIIVSNGINIRAKGAGAQIRGYRPDLFLCDDIEEDEGVRSEERRKHLKEWFRKAVIGTLDPNGQLIIIGTILHYLSLLNDLIENGHKYGWEIRLYQAYKGGLQEEGKELWKEKWPHNELQKRKLEIGTFAFSSEYMNNPVPEDAAAFKKDYIKHFTDLPPSSSVMVFDPAYTESDTADYKVCSVIAKDGLGNRYLDDYVRTRQPMGDYLSQSVNLYKRLRPQKVGIPTGTEKLFYNQVVEFFRQHQCYPVFEEIKNVATTASGQSVRKKEARIVASLQGLFQSGKYYLRKSHTEAVEELLTFPAGKFDDIIDTMASAEQIITNTYIETAEDKEYQEKMAKKQLTDRGSTGYGI